MADLTRRLGSPRHGVVLPVGDERVMRVPIRITKNAIEPAVAEAVLSLKNTGSQFEIENDRSPYTLGPNGMGFIGRKAREQRSTRC